MMEQSYREGYWYSLAHKAAVMQSAEFLEIFTYLLSWRMASSSTKAKEKRQNLYSSTFQLELPNQRDMRCAQVYFVDLIYRPFNQHFIPKSLLHRAMSPVLLVAVSKSHHVDFQDFQQFQACQARICLRKLHHLVIQHQISVVKADETMCFSRFDPFHHHFDSNFRQIQVLLCFHEVD